MTVGSKDGTPIAYERQGDGPAVILVGGGATDRSENAPLAVELAARFTAFNYDRRGPRGQRRHAAVRARARVRGPRGLDRGGGRLRRALRSLLGRRAGARGRSGRRARAAAGGLRGADAFARFMRLAGSSEDGIAAARSSPVWPDCEAIAHTLVYDAACLGDGRPPTERLATISQPTLVANGAGEFFHPAADAIADAVPNSQRRVLEGQGHVAGPKVMATVLTEFLA